MQCVAGCMYGCMRLASRIAVNTTLAAASGGLSSLFCETLLGHPGDISPILNGILAGKLLHLVLPQHPTLPYPERSLLLHTYGPYNSCAFPPRCTTSLTSVAKLYTALLYADNSCFIVAAPIVILLSILQLSRRSTSLARRACGHNLSLLGRGALRRSHHRCNCWHHHACIIQAAEAHPHR